MNGRRVAWLGDTPPRRLASASVVLTPPGPDDVEPLVAAANESLPELQPWMPWAQEPATATTIAGFVGQTTGDWWRRTAFIYLTRDPGTGLVIGGCGLHARLGVGALEVGYWVRTSHTGRGVATAAARLLTEAALDLDGVGRVEIRCDAANTRSAGVARRLGYRLAAIRPRPPATPGETEEQMIWIRARNDPGPDQPRT